MKCSLLILPVAILLTLPPAPACGPFFKATLLSVYPEGNGRILLAPPVADVFAEILTAPGAPSLPEDKVAKVPEKPAALPDGLTISGEDLSKDAWAVLQRDLTDLGEALGQAEGRLAVLVGYAQARRVGLLKLPVLLQVGPAGARAPVGTVWPKGLPAEFRLYAEGAGFFQEGRLIEAKAAWEKLLALPEEQRRYRSTWAAWMLARTGFLTDPAAAVAGFRRIRMEAGAGHDSLNRAAASFGWEALAEEKLMESDPGGFSTARAARIVWLLAQHAGSGGGEPYFLSGRHFATHQELPVRRITELALGWMQDPERARAGAASPFLRQVMTSCLLPIRRMAPVAADALPAQEPEAPAIKWFAALEAVDPGGSEDLADRLAWAAYESGDYPQSAGWLKRARESPMAHWLMAKQALQAGKVAEAAQHLESARPGFAIKAPQTSRHEDYEGYPEEASALQREQFQADLGLVRLALDDFPGSLDALSRSGFSEDAAYVMENVLTADEAVKFAIKWPLDPLAKGSPAVLPVPLTVDLLTAWLEESPDTAAATEITPEPEEAGDYSSVGPLHHAIARRLAREDRTKVSREFLPTRLRPVLDLFLKQRAIGQNKDLTRAQRAAGYWKAALIHRYAGMELWGYEGFPDNAQQGGAFDADNLREARLGMVRPGNAGDPDTQPPVYFPAVSDAEKARLMGQVSKPGKRFNYRYHAYSLATQAFELLPDNSEELAAMINLTGWWFAKFDETAARRSLAELQRRCPRTVLGRQAKEKDWVVPMEAALEASIKHLD